MSDSATLPAAQQPPAKAEPSTFRLVATLTVAGLCSGLALVGTVQATAPAIKRNQLAALQKAALKVVPEAAKMKKLAFEGGKLQESTSDSPELLGTYDKSGKFVGYAIVAVGSGYAGDIRLLYGYSPAKKKIVGFNVLESKETPGIGDKIFKDQSFVDCFSALEPSPEIVAVKKGSRSKPNEIDAISGATISTNAVVKGINDANKKWLGKLPAEGLAGGGQ